MTPKITFQCPKCGWTYKSPVKVIEVSHDCKARDMVGRSVALKRNDSEAENFSSSRKASKLKKKEGST